MIKLHSLPLTLLVFILLFSCKKDANSILGDDLNSHRNINEYYTDTVFHITAFTVPDDSLYLENYTSFLLGTVKNDIFGTTTYNLVSRILFNSTASYIQTEGETVEHIDSAILLIPYSVLYPLAENSDFLQGRSFTLTLYEVDEDIRTSTEQDSAYNIHSEVAYKPTPLHTETVTLHPPLSTDTTETENIKIYIDNATAKKIADALEEVGLDNSSDFPTKFKGLYFVITPATSEDQSIVASFNAETTYGTQLTIYFNGNGEESSPSYYNFALGTHFTQIKKDRSGSEIESALWDSVKGQDRLYLESIGGSRIRFKIPNLRFLTDTVQNPSATRKPLVINRATLVFKIADTSSSGGIQPPSNVFLYKYISSISGETIIDYSFNSGGVYDEAKGEYKIYITRWMQNLLYHNDEEIPYLDLSSITDIRYFTPSQVIFYGTAAGANSVRLEVIYSLVE
ncbi:MAG: DUF4270 domain-containing protein [Bacteroidales bacterium]|jgi:hypothetical protein|nr:DUF4270 domain-containing protein [Bacteroidales bacterium]